jgi:Flp pilus assembly protein TadG
MRIPRSTRGRDERGQVLVIFALALVAIVAMTGLVLDGGDTFVRRRDQQNVADAAAMAAGYAYANGATATAIAAAAYSTTASNGYPNLTDGVVVAGSLSAAGSAARDITVTLPKPHPNNFAGIVGLPYWGVTTTATVRSGRPNGVVGAMPIIFNQKAFNGNGSGAGHEIAYDEPPSGNEDVPQNGSQFNWTEFCNNCNADSNTVRDLINGGGVKTVVKLSDHISPLNAGSHTTLFSALSNLIGQEVAVPIVDDDGNMVGWAMFHLTGSVGGSTKQIRGYFVSPINPAAMVIDTTAPAGGDFGSYRVYLVN